jgi:Mg-chelatase subunit ChlD
VALTTLAACSRSPQPSSGDGQDGGSTNDGSNGSDLPSWWHPGGAGGAGYGSGGTTGTGGTSVGGGGELPPGCTQHTIRGERLPIDLYMMIDTSASMLQKTADGSTKWEAVRSALSAFFADPRSAGIGVGLQFFPRVVPGATRECTSDAACGAHGPCFGIRTCSGRAYIDPCGTDADCGAGRTCIPFGYCATINDFCTPVGGPCAGGADTCDPIVEGYCLGRDSCTNADYATPAVSIAQLPAAAGALGSALAAQLPDGYTPTGSALSGALDHARTLAKGNSDRKLAVVMATDGLPTSCQPKEIGSVAAIAQKAFSETPSIPTFVIGVFAPAEQGAIRNLNQLAAGGGTSAARIVDSSRNLTQSFLAALDDIRTTALACEIKVPMSTSQQNINYDNVNVQFTGSSGQQVTIPYVGDASRCDITLGGWYYDIDPARGTPTRIVTCEKSCGLLRSDAKGRLDILIGCKTIVIQ